MSWHDFYRRRDALAAVLADARHDPAAPLRSAEVFGEPEQVLLALHHTWTMRLTGRLGVELNEAERQHTGDRVAAVSAAVRATAADNPVLRAVLDAHSAAYATALRPALDNERRLVAIAAGLADADEPADDIAAVGAAFLALVLAAPGRPGEPIPVTAAGRGCLPARVATTPAHA